MTSIEELQARANALLTQTESSESVEAKVASTEGPAAASRPSSRPSSIAPSRWPAS